jgi:hypothetical protein
MHYYKKQHEKTYGDLTDELRQNMISQVIPSLISQESIFKNKAVKMNQLFAPVSSSGSNHKKRKTCTDFDYVKHCLLAAVKKCVQIRK